MTDHLIPTLFVGVVCFDLGLIAGAALLAFGLAAARGEYLEASLKAVPASARPDPLFAGSVNPAETPEGD